MTESQIKETGVALLEKVDSFCREHNLKYFLCYGTLLGAIRHKGFIPWDDDIDIMMPSKDYRKFVQIARNGLDKNTPLLYPEYNNKFFRPFARVYDNKTRIEFTTKKNTYETGIWIDIFPIEGLPKNKLRRKIHFSIQSIYRYMIIAHFKENRSQSKAREFVRLIFKALINEKTCRKLVLATMKRSNKYKFEDCELVGVSVAAYKDKNTHKMIDIEPASKVKFEGKEFLAPKDSKIYLKTIYNDYKKLPPPQKQVAHHDFVAYRVEEDK